MSRLLLSVGRSMSFSFILLVIFIHTLSHAQHTAESQTTRFPQLSHHLPYSRQRAHRCLCPQNYCVLHVLSLSCPCLSQLSGEQHTVPRRLYVV